MSTQIDLSPHFYISFKIDKRALGDFIGKYQSLFKGQGLEYNDIRPYVPGDDPKAFVWSKFAQLGQPYVKTFVEERDLSVFVAVDISGSMVYANPKKHEKMVQTAALLISSAAISKDRVGLFLFSDQISRFVPPHKGIRHAGALLHILEEIRPTGSSTYIKKCFREMAAKRGVKRGIIFIISDFVSDDGAFDDELILLSLHHQVVLIRVFDTLDESMQAPGWVVVEDPEKKKARCIYLGDTFVQDMIDLQAEEGKKLAIASTRSRSSLCEMATDADPLQTLSAFFAREKLLQRNQYT